MFIHPKFHGSSNMYHEGIVKSKVLNFNFNFYNKREFSLMKTDLHKKGKFHIIQVYIL